MGCKCPLDVSRTHSDRRHLFLQSVFRIDSTQSEFKARHRIQIKCGDEEGFFVIYSCIEFNKKEKLTKYLSLYVLDMSSKDINECKSYVNTTIIF